MGTPASNLKKLKVRFNRLELFNNFFYEENDQSQTARVDKNRANGKEENFSGFQDHGGPTRFFGRIWARTSDSPFLNCSCEPPEKEFLGF